MKLRIIFDLILRFYNRTYIEVIMLKRFNFPACPVETALMMMGNRWNVLIVRELLTGIKRF